ncbi:hypothetical protein SLE2022_147200 [Rubroshorea leprosula]
MKGTYEFDPVVLLVGREQNLHEGLLFFLHKEQFSSESTALYLLQFQLILFLFSSSFLFLEFLSQAHCFYPHPCRRRLHPPNSSLHLYGVYSIIALLYLSIDA